MKFALICAAAWAFTVAWDAQPHGEASGQVSGSVLDASGAPVTGVALILVSLERAFQTTSASNGIYRFVDLEPGRYELQATSPGFKKRTVPVTIGDAEPKQTVAVVLAVGMVPDPETCGREVSVRYGDRPADGLQLAGTLHDSSDRRPIANAKIEVRNGSNGQTAATVRSDHEGKFALKGLAPDYYELLISRRGYHSEHLKHVALPRQNLVSVESTLTRLGLMVVCQ